MCFSEKKVVHHRLCKCVCLRNLRSVCRWEQQVNCYKSRIEQLASFILREYPDEPGSWGTYCVHDDFRKRAKSLVFFYLLVEAAGVEPASEIVGNKERLHAQSCSAWVSLCALRTDKMRASLVRGSRPCGPYPATRTSLLCDASPKARRRSPGRRLLN